MNNRATILSLGILAAMSAPAAANGTLFPQTRAVRQQLDSIHTNLKSVASRLETAKGAVEDTRKKVETASTTVKSVDKTDDVLVETIRQLKSVSSLPQLKALQALVKNLESLQNKVHKVRENGDKAEKEVFTPLRAKLLKLEDDLKLTIVEVLGTAERARLANEAIGLTRAEIQRRGNPNGPVAALEALSRRIRVAMTPVESGLTKLDAAAEKAEKVAKGISTVLNVFNVMEPAVVKVAKSLDPVGASAHELDKVLSTKLSLKLFGKEFGFTVRQILEGPGKIADFILKPFEELADKALSPILKKLQIDIPLPAEFEKIPAALETVTRKMKGFEGPLANLEKSVDAEFLKHFQKLLDTVKPPRK